MAVRIKSVVKNSSADKHNIKSGETLVSINGNSIVDVLDYRFYQINSLVELEIHNSENSPRIVNIKKNEYDEIGLEFDTYLMDKQQSCKNKCVFCFIDQLPSGLRESLYFKDDDSRLSFLFGNYITLTNITRHEIDRIIKMHISPINVSVHTTNPELRVTMMKNKNAGNALEVLQEFAKASIKINCQIVLCPNLNDADELDKTLNDLVKLYPSIECVAIVPVGLTKHRDGLYPLVEFTKESAIKTLNQIENFGNDCLNKFGKRIAFASDEFYIKAEKDIPPADFYEGFEQLENGVGLISLLRDEFEYYFEEVTASKDLKRKVTIATGTAAKPYIEELANKLTDKFPNVKIQTIGIKNNFFGGGVDVTGLVTGSDIIKQIKNIDIGDNLLVPSVMLRHERDIFLDDVSIIDLEKELNTNVILVDNNAEDLINAILGL